MPVSTDRHRQPYLEGLPDPWSNGVSTLPMVRDYMAKLRIVCVGDTHGLHRRTVIPPGDILIHAGEDGKLGMTDLNRGELLCVWSVHTAPVTSIRLNRDQTGVWSMGQDGVMAFSNIVRTNDKVWEGTLTSAGGDTPGVRPVFSMSSDCDHILTNHGGAANIVKLPHITPGPDTQPDSLENILALSSSADNIVTTEVLWCTGDCSPAITADSQGNIKIYTLLKQ